MSDWGNFKPPPARIGVFARPGTRPEITSELEHCPLGDAISFDLAHSSYVEGDRVHSKLWLAGEQALRGRDLWNDVEQYGKEMTDAPSENEDVPHGVVKRSSPNEEDDTESIGQAAGDEQEESGGR